MSGFIPKEFARRKPRPLEDLARFKATELHFILNHAGPIIFKGRMPDELYNHFLILHAVIRILGTEELFRWDGVIDWCKVLLKNFVEDAKTRYGEHFISYNIHNLIHVPDDVLFFFCALYDFSCFCFENHLQIIKKNSHFA